MVKMRGFPLVKDCQQNLLPLSTLALIVPVVTVVPPMLLIVTMLLLSLLLQLLPHKGGI